MSTRGERPVNTGVMGGQSVVQALEPTRRQTAGRVPPHNLEAEESLLGAMMLSRDAITSAVEARVEASDFYKPAHTHVYEAVMSLYSQGEPVDPITVAEELRRADLLDALGGKNALLRIQALTPASAKARLTTGTPVARCWRDATSGTTPPYSACTRTCDATTSERTRRPSSTTDAAVSSQDVSIPRTNMSVWDAVFYKLFKTARNSRA